MNIPMHAQLKILLAVAKLIIAFFVLTSLCLACYAQTTPLWKHPLGIPHGDVTYDEWVKITGFKKHQKTEVILQQLISQSEKDIWAGFIASEILLNISTDASKEKSFQLLTLAAKKGNPLAMSYLGMTLYRQGSIDEGIRLLDEAASSGHPRSKTLRIIAKSLPDNETRDKLQRAKSEGDELAAFGIAMIKESINHPKGLATQEAYALIVEASKMNGFLSKDPVKRIVTKATDAPHSIFYSSQALFFSKKELELSEFNFIEESLKDVAERNSPRDKRTYWFVGEDVAIRANMLLAELYEKGPLKNADHAESRYIRASEMGLPIASTSLAYFIYNPKTGLKPNSRKYIHALELAVKQGGAKEALDLAREYARGEFVEADYQKVKNLVQPFIKVEERTPKEFLPELNTLLYESMLHGNLEEREGAIRELENNWSTSGNPDSALLLAKTFTRERSNPKSRALSRQWFNRAFDGYLKISRPKMAEAVAIQAAGDALTANEISTYEYWKKNTLSLNPKTKSIFDSSDVFIKIAQGDIEAINKNISNLKNSAKQGDVFANAALGFLAFSLPADKTKEISLENYTEYFDATIKLDGKLMTPPLIGFFLQVLGPERRDELILWLQKTKEFHGPEESALLNFLKFSNDSVSSADLEVIIKNLIGDINKGSGFAAGFVAERINQGDKRFANIGFSEVELLLKSTSSVLPYPDSFALLAERFIKGDEINKDIDSAKFLLKRGAEIGSKKSMLLIARYIANGDFGVADYDEALRFATLAAYYGEPEAIKLVAEIEGKKSRKTREVETVQLQKSLPQKTVQPQNHRSQNSPQQSSGSSFFSELGSFLGTLLEIGLIVGLIALTGGAIAAGMGGGGMPIAPPPTFSPPTTQVVRSTHLVPKPVYQSIGVPDYSSGKANYTSTPSPVSPIVTPSANRISNITIMEKFNYDPASKLKGTVSADGTFTAKSISGDSIRGSIKPTPSGKIEIQVRPTYDWDPANNYRGEVDSSGTVKLKNSATGRSINGQYEWSNSYGVR